MCKLGRAKVRLETKLYLKYNIEANSVMWNKHRLSTSKTFLKTLSGKGSPYKTKIKSNFQQKSSYIFKIFNIYYNFLLIFKLKF